MRTSQGGDALPIQTDLVADFDFKPYQQLEQLIQPGDVIAFGGNSLFSRWAKLTTRSVVTHLALVLDTKTPYGNPQSPIHQIIESTCYGGNSGVMINRLCERIATYDGSVWWLPLSEASRNTFELNKTECINFLRSQLYKPYDISQLFGSTVDATDTLPFFRYLSYNVEDFSQWFCSELVAAALGIGKLIHNINASECTPIDICQLAIFHQRYTQIRGPKTAISGFNTILPANFMV
ncbi:hypothetical protein [Flavobacterium sp. W21_SRS_FM6]|uniref:hypothetical protein n=1 Tax=Flavobacterium sp. W21_SRS_FM6 TaxID=3240268 RepID=UPI003F8E6082